MLTKQYYVNVLIAGRAATKYTKDAYTYIEGRDGKDYELELVNDSYWDAEFVVSVDGLSITDGKFAGTESTGYIVPARSRHVIKGWLLDRGTAAKFKFGEKQNSYTAAITGSDSNTGVIGLQVYSKKPEPVLPYIYQPNWLLNQSPVTWYGSSSDPYVSSTFGSVEPTISAMNLSATRSMRSADVAPVSKGFESNLGTEFGDATNFQTTSVTFERATKHPLFQHAIYYADAKELNRLGIQLDWQKPTVKRPDPFPADQGKYCTPPVNWRR